MIESFSPEIHHQRVFIVKSGVFHCNSLVNQLSESPEMLENHENWGFRVPFAPRNIFGMSKTSIKVVSTNINLNETEWYGSIILHTTVVDCRDFEKIAKIITFSSFWGSTPDWRCSCEVITGPIHPFHPVSQSFINILWYVNHFFDIRHIFRGSFGNFRFWGTSDLERSPQPKHCIPTLGHRADPEFDRLGCRDAPKIIVTMFLVATG